MDRFGAWDRRQVYSRIGNCLRKKETVEPKRKKNSPKLLCGRSWPAAPASWLTLRRLASSSSLQTIWPTLSLWRLRRRLMAASWCRRTTCGARHRCYVVRPPVVQHTKKTIRRRLVLHDFFFSFVRCSKAINKGGPPFVMVTTFSYFSFRRGNAIDFGPHRGGI